MPPLAFHLLPQTNVSDWCSWASGQMAQQSAPWVKTCSAEHIYWLRLYGAQRVYYRPCFLRGDSGEGDCADGTAWGRIVAAEIARTGAHWPDAVGYRNEMNPTAANATQYHAYRAALRAAGFTGQVVYGSFSNGRPDWPAYATIPADADALELHEYFGLTVAGSPDLALRHVEAIRRGLLPTSLPLYIGETGADDCGDGTGTRGWQQKMTAAEMAAQLAAYRAGCAPSVVAAFVFADGDNGDPQWASYATRGTPLEAAIRATWPSQQTGTTVASLPIPIDDQLTSDGPNRYNECGPACIRMVCDYLGIDPGESIDAIDADETGNEQYVGYTTTQQMVAWFQARGVPAVASQPADMGAAVAGNLARGWPCIWLGVWDRANLTGGHFEAPVAVDSAGAVTLNNPYGGYRETLSAADFARYSLGWLVTVQQQKETPMPDDPLTAAAKARWEALGVGANPATAIFAAYLRRFRAYATNGNDAVLDPTPCIRAEVTTPDKHAYAQFDCGEIYHWSPAKGAVFIAEQKEHAAIYAACGWGQPS